jgi:hypothetical protein
VTDLGVVGHLGDSHRERDRLASHLVRLPGAVPALVVLHQRSPQRRVEAEPRCEQVGDLAVRARVIAHRQQLAKRACHRERPADRSFALAGVAQDRRQHLAGIAVVEALSLAPERDLVAERRGR